MGIITSRRLPLIVLRVIALFNASLGLLGAFDLRTSIWGISDLSRIAALHSKVAEFPMRAEVFWIILAINAACLALLLLSTPFLWQARKAGRILCNVALLLEIGYWLAVPIAKFGLLRWGGDFGLSLRGTLSLVEPLARLGLSTQFETLYPIFAVVLVNLCYTAIGRTLSQTQR